jgi:hypothetical protein
VPAAAVIPAPIGYIKVVAVKKLVVEFLLGRSLARPPAMVGRSRVARHFVGRLGEGSLSRPGATRLLRANWSAQSRLYGFEHLSLE